MPFFLGMLSPPYFLDFRDLRAFPRDFGRIRARWALRFALPGAPIFPHLVFLVFLVLAIDVRLHFLDVQMPWDPEKTLLPWPSPRIAPHHDVLSGPAIGIAFHAH